MATTTNFGWTTPNDTDLVKDGAAAIRTLGQAIDTSMADLEGGTTGQILAKNSNTDMDFVWIANDQGDITAVTAGTGISGGGTSGAVTITNSMATAITTAGDLIKGTGSGTFDRLGIGSTGQVLTVASGAPAWATPSSGAFTLLSTTSLSSATTTVSSIDGTYKHLMINAKIKPNQSANKTAFQLNGNGMPFIQQLSNEGTPTSVTNFSDNTTKVNLYGNADHDPQWGDGFLNLMIYNYANNVNSSAKFKTMFFQSIASNASGNAIYSQGTAFYIANSTALSSFSLLTSGTAFTSGEIKIYGVN